MDVANVLRMKTGDADDSFAHNAIVAKSAITKTLPVLIDIIREMWMNGDASLLPECFRFADLGCSSGPNTFIVASQIIETVYEICVDRDLKTPEFEISLNDLLENDFNTIFKMIPGFYEKMKKDKGDKLGPCFVSGVPGSFYGRLFPSRSLHFVYSSYSLHWLSKVPVGIENNMHNIYIAKSSPPNIAKAYLDQFERDFSMFLKLRSVEIVPKGRMLLVFLGRSSKDPFANDSCCLLELLAKSLKELVHEGLVEECALDSFHLPIYNAYKGEVEEIVKHEGSFNIEKLDTLKVNWDPNDDVGNKNFVFNNFKSGQNASKIIRAVFEPFIANHFGYKIIDRLFDKFTTHVADHLSVEKTKHLTIILSLSRKEV